jgi:hypothetical protein
MRYAKTRARMKTIVRRSPRRAAAPGGGRGAIVPLLDDLLEFRATSPRLSGGDVDADWRRALDSGEEAVGGSAPTPDQDVVDELGRALGVEQGAEDEVWTSGEILKARDRHYWHLERLNAAREDEP